MENMRSLALPVEPASVPAQKQAPDRQFLMFPYLHQDVRLLIWEAALRPRPSKNYNAVHSFRVNFWEAEDPRSHEMSDVGHKSPQIFGYRVMDAVLGIIEDQRAGPHRRRLDGFLPDQAA